MMKFQEVQDAWKASQGGSFYDSFEEATGLTRIEVSSRFSEWNELTHEEAERIALRHGTTVQEGGFQAYLAEVGENTLLMTLMKSLYSEDPIEAIAKEAAGFLTDEDISELREALAAEDKANSTFTKATAKTNQVREQVLRRVIDRWTAPQPLGENNNA